MRDLQTSELRQVYGANGGGRCNPTPPSCGGGSKPKKTNKSCKTNKTHKSNKSRGGCYC
ncbi:MAG: hypothetical protein JF593_08570 [Novosphingobium sp.]|nr:hypothetical protein [Novosphingobium sp.]